MRGYGSNSVFGGVVPTPTLEGLARRSLRYTQMHNTALCSPTRAALLTGRNHHAVHYGTVAEAATGYPAYDSVTPPETAYVARTLNENGYATAWFGKAHNVPVWEATPAGPFNHWPVGQGYDYFYGFVGGDTSQWQPGNLFRSTTPIHPYNAKTGWNLNTAIADEAIDYIHTQTATNPRRPWFIHFAPGATHAPHHPTPEWVEKISSMHLFDEGWNKVAERIFENQKRLGVVPPNAKLPPWPDDLLPRWENWPLPKTLPFTWAWDETFDIGLDTGTSVDDMDYEAPFPFTGKLEKITFDLGESSVTPQSIRAMMQLLAKKRDR
jgi:arylsulfatase A-like enzyme